METTYKEYKTKFMDKLPTVISCCFCCFLRAGTVMIALVSFIIGLIVAPNVANTKGFWDISTVLSNYSTVTESTIQIILGVVSIMLCVVSVLLMIGSCCNMPILIEIYQWGAICYSGTVSFMFLILAFMCFFVHPDSWLAGVFLCIFVVCNVVLTAYFVIVTNSLRLSLKYLLTSNELSI